MASIIETFKQLRSEGIDGYFAMKYAEFAKDTPVMQEGYADLAKRVAAVVSEGSLLNPLCFLEASSAEKFLNALLCLWRGLWDLRGRPRTPVMLNMLCGKRAQSGSLLVMPSLLYTTIMLCHYTAANTVSLNSAGAKAPYGYDAENYSEADEG